MEENKQAQEELEETVAEETNKEENVVTNEEETQEADLAQELAQVKQEKDALYDRFLRVQAEYDNFRRRTQKEKEAALKYKSQDLVTELLPAIDNFERALQLEVQEETVKSFVDGIKMVYRQLKEALDKAGVEEIETTGTPFDPQIHQAVMQVSDENYESNEVVEELQKGYMLKDRVIRPAMVKVNQ